MKHLKTHKLFEEFKLTDIKNKTVKTAIDVIKSYGVKVKIQKIKETGHAICKEHTIIISESRIKYYPVDEIVSILFHELGHIYCYDEGKFKAYHRPEHTEEGIKSIIRTAIRAELYVEKWAKQEMKKYFPHLKFQQAYRPVKWIKEFLRNYFYESYEEWIIHLETEKLGKILDEMGI